MGISTLRLRSLPRGRAEHIQQQEPFSTTSALSPVVFLGNLIWEHLCKYPSVVPRLTHVFPSFHPGSLPLARVFTGPPPLNPSLPPKSAPPPQFRHPAVDRLSHYCAHGQRCTSLYPSTSNPQFTKYEGVMPSGSTRTVSFLQFEPFEFIVSALKTWKRQVEMAY